MDSSNLRRSAPELAAMLSRGAVDAGALCREAVRLAAADRAALNAFTSVADPDEVSAAAARAHGSRLGGLPIAVKDNIDIAGLPTTAGTPALRNMIPAADSTAIAILRRAGAIVIGKTNMHELAAGMTSNNRHFGPVRNPHDPSLISGGSSGGSAVAVAAGIVPVALGTDTGGSCRVPAALTGCVGFRPTIGRYPMDGVLLLSITRDTIGLFARDVAGIQLFDAVLSGAGEAPALTAPDAPASADLRRMRIGVPRPYFFESLDPEVETIVEAALERMRRAGAVVVETEVPNAAQLNADTSLPLILYESLRGISTYLNRHRSPIPAWEVVDQVAGEFERAILQRELAAEAVPHAVYVEILRAGRPALIEAYRQCFSRARLDALALPTTPLPARPIGQDELVLLNGQPVPTLATYMRNCDPAAVAGLPSISVPAGRTAARLPVGLSFDGLPETDAKLLAIASAFERACDADVPP